MVARGEVFRVGERRQPDGGPSYDFTWLNGPAGGTYGFTIGATSGRILRSELEVRARHFVEAFYGPGGIGESDFPDHVPAEGAESDARE